MFFRVFISAKLQKQPSVVIVEKCIFKNFEKTHRKTTVPEAHNKVAERFTVNFVKFLITPFLQNTKTL